VFSVYLDGIVHLLYTSNQHKFQNCDDVMRLLNITPRITPNSKADPYSTIKFISWQINVSINIVGIRGIKCPTHSHRNMFVYTFQNTCLKLLRKCDYPPINILIYKQKIYIININLLPKLINIQDQKNINFRNKLITHDIVSQIIDNRLQVAFDFKINIYTSYAYLQKNSKSLVSNMIGQYLPDELENDYVLHIFISPSLDGDSFFMHQLDITTSVVFQEKSIFANTHLSEGNKISFPRKTDPDKSLNNLHCVCDHPKTEKFFPPPPHKFKNLGNLI
jgi:hypothetical protein